MNTRLCPTCKRTIEITRSLDGLYSYCAHCNREYHTPGRFNEQALYDADILSEDETQEQLAVLGIQGRVAYDVILKAPFYVETFGQNTSIYVGDESKHYRVVIVEVEDTDNETP